MKCAAAHQPQRRQPQQARKRGRKPRPRGSGRSAAERVATTPLHGINHSRVTVPKIQNTGRQPLMARISPAGQRPDRRAEGERGTAPPRWPSPGAAGGTRPRRSSSYRGTRSPSPIRGAGAGPSSRRTPPAQPVRNVLSAHSATPAGKHAVDAVPVAEPADRQVSSARRRQKNAENGQPEGGRRESELAFHQRRSDPDRPAIDVVEAAPKARSAGPQPDHRSAPAFAGLRHARHSRSPATSGEATRFVAKGRGAMGGTMSEARESASSQPEGRSTRPIRRAERVPDR
jgi:hypothetical protein